MREETRCRHMGYSFRLAARVLLYAPSHRQDSTHHSLCYTSRGALAGMRNSSMSPPHEGSIRRPIAPWANALTTELQGINKDIYVTIYTLQIGHKEKPNVILGPTHFFSRIILQQCRWNTWPHRSWNYEQFIYKTNIHYNI